MTSRAELDWTNRTGIEWHYIAPGKPQQNAFAESFNGRFREVTEAEPGAHQTLKASVILLDNIIEKLDLAQPREAPDLASHTAFAVSLAARREMGLRCDIASIRGLTTGRKIRICRHDD